MCVLLIRLAVYFNICTCLRVYLWLQEYAADGLRTLALAYRDLSEDEWETWSESHRCADKATDCREDRLAATYEQIEQDMVVRDFGLV